MLVCMVTTVHCPELSKNNSQGIIWTICTCYRPLHFKPNESYDLNAKLTTRLQSSQVKRTPQDFIHEFIIGSCRFYIHLCILPCIMSHDFTCEAVVQFLPAQLPWIWCKCLRSNFIHSKIFNLTNYKEVLAKYSLFVMHAGMQLWIWH